MRKQRNHSQLKIKRIPLKRANNETDLFSLTDSKFKKEIMKILKDLRKNINKIQITLKRN